VTTRPGNASRPDRDQEVSSAAVLELRRWRWQESRPEPAATPELYRPQGAILLCLQGHRTARRLDDLRAYRQPCPTCGAEVWEVVGVFPPAPRYGLAPLDLSGLPCGILGTVACPLCYGPAEPIAARGVRLAFRCGCGATFHRSTWPLPLDGGGGAERVTPARDAAATG
jgi:hypothetical protein